MQRSDRMSEKIMENRSPSRSVRKNEAFWKDEEGYQSHSSTYRPDKNDGKNTACCRSRKHESTFTSRGLNMFHHGAALVASRSSINNPQCGLFQGRLFIYIYIVPLMLEDEMLQIPKNHPNCL